MGVNQFFRDFLFLIFAVYFAQGYLYTSGSLLSKGCLLLIIIISSVYFVKTLYLKKKEDSFYFVWTALLLLNVFGFIFTADFSDILVTDMFKSVLICMLPFYPFYFFAKKNVLNSSHLIRFFAVLFPIAILQFYFNQSSIILKSETDSVNVVNNVSYSFVMMIPFLFLIKNKKIIKFLLLMLIVFFILQGAKRGAIITGAVGLILYVLLQLFLIPKNKRFTGYLIVLTGLFIIVFYANNFYINNEFLFARINSIAEGDTSGREVIYDRIFNFWYESESLINILFGFGFAGSISISGGNYAHNDWLELLSNFGLLGFTIYLMLFYVAIKEFWNKNWRLDKQMLILTIALMWFFTSLYSMWYTAIGGYTQAILLAYLIGSEKDSLV